MGNEIGGGLRVHRTSWARTGEGRPLGGAAPCVEAVAEDDGLVEVAEGSELPLLESKCKTYV